MIKKLRDKAKGKKGFTLVELIVVIVIILILAAVMVPQLLRYVDRAREANAKAEAATILSQVQADFADSKVGTTPYTGGTINGVTVAVVETIPATMTASSANVVIATDAATQEDSITNFAYCDGTYTAVWVANAAANTDAWTMIRGTNTAPTP